MTIYRTHLIVVLLALTACTGSGSSEDESRDATPSDASEQPDAGRADAGVGDAGPHDGGLRDAGSPDVMIVETGQFQSGLDPCGLGYDHVAGRVWVVACSATSVQSFTRDGTLDTAVPIGGETPNDVDIDIASEAMTLNGVSISEGALLFINGESGGAEIYELDKAGTGTTALLVTAFGASHVVGGGYHNARDTFFLVQDRQAGATEGNRVSEIDPDSGAVVSTFQTAPEFIVNFGDLDVCQSTGHIFIVSSVEGTVAEFDVDGVFIAEYPLPPGVVGSAGIDFDDPTGEAWISGTNGTIWQLAGLPCGPS